VNYKLLCYQSSRHAFISKKTYFFIPCKPKKCIGKKVKFTPKNNPQKCILPFLSLYVNPSAFGDQKYHAAKRAKTAPIDNT